MAGTVPAFTRRSRRPCSPSSMTGVFLAALIASQSSSWMPLVDGAGSNCATDQNVCDLDMGEFCGTDGFCHEYNCQDFFDFGPLEFTGKNLTVDGRTLTMECAPRDASDTRIRNALIYGCGGFINGKPPPSKGVSLEFNERCIVQISSIASYECFRMADSTSDSVFEEFEGRVNASSIDCEGEVSGFGDPLPQYIYAITTSFYVVKPMNVLESVIVARGINSTATLEKDTVLTRTMDSFLAAAAGTMSPSPPPTDAPTANPTSAAERLPFGAAPVTMAFMFLTMLASVFAMPFVPEK